MNGIDRDESPAPSPVNPDFTHFAGVNKHLKLHASNINELIVLLDQTDLNDPEYQEIIDLIRYECFLISTKVVSELRRQSPRHRR
jgi:hypothetical protein